jgi:hypothetical protein
MDIAIAVMLGLQQAVFGFAGAVVALGKWSRSARVRFAILFGILSLVGFALITWQALRAVQSYAENRKTLLGDAERPPFVAVISLPGNTRFVTTNISDYPAYGTKIQLYDDANRSVPLRTFDYPEMAAHLAFLDDKPWTPDDNAPEHHFTAQISTRTGLVFEELILHRTDNNQWMRASRVRQGMRTLEEDVDSSWPRNDKGQIEWK